MPLLLSANMSTCTIPPIIAVATALGHYTHRALWPWPRGGRGLPRLLLPEATVFLVCVHATPSTPTWHPDTPLPVLCGGFAAVPFKLGGPDHQLCCIADEALLVLGNKEGPFTAIAVDGQLPWLWL
jgi:hypothetical protein